MLSSKYDPAILDIQFEPLEIIFRFWNSKQRLNLQKLTNDKYIKQLLIIKIEKISWSWKQEPFIKSLWMLTYSKIYKGLWDYLKREILLVNNKNPLIKLMNSRLS